MSMIGMGIGILDVAMILCVIAAFGFWLWMLIDCLLRSDEAFRGKNDRLIWTLVIILTNFVGAFIYLFVVKLRAQGQDRQNGQVM